MFKKKSVEYRDGEREKKSVSLILVKVLIYLICALAVATSGLTRISEANSLIGSTAYTVNTSYGQVISGGSTDSTPAPAGKNVVEPPSVVTNVYEPEQNPASVRDDNLSNEADGEETTATQEKQDGVDSDILENYGEAKPLGIENLPED